MNIQKLGSSTNMVMRISAGLGKPCASVFAIPIKMNIRDDAN